MPDLLVGLCVLGREADILRREALPLYGRKLADALASPREGALVTLFPHHWKDEGAEELECDWTAFFDVLGTRRPFRGRMHQPGFTACSFAPSVRVLAHVRAVSAVVLRFGRQDRVSLDSFLTRWAEHAGFVFTTAEHSTMAASFVAVLPYTRLVSLDEHRGVIEEMAASAKRDGRPFDLGARNPARFVHLPGAVPGRSFEGRPLCGDAFVVPLKDRASAHTPRTKRVGRPVRLGNSIT